MKKRFLYLMFAVVAFSMQSCLHDDNDVFDKSAAERIDEAVANAKSVLESAHNGWHLEYYLGSEYVHGGYNFLVKFEDGKATVAGEIAGDNTMTTRSSYDVVKDQGPVLTFNTYNEILHFLSQPYQDQVDGFEGDFEFVVLDVTDDRIELKGKKWGNHMVLTRMPEDISWEEYLNGITNISDNMMYTYNGAMDGAAVVGEIDEDNHLRIAGTTEELYEPFIYTTTGLKLREPATFAGATVQNFTYNIDNFTLTCDEYPGLVLTAELPEGYMFYNEVNEKIVGSYRFSYYYGLRNVNVTIAENADKTGWVLSGLVPNHDINITYDKKAGAAIIFAQLLGNDSRNNPIYLAMWGLRAGGNLTWSTQAGVKLIPSETGFTFEDAGTYPGVTADSFILWDGANSDQCSDAAFLVNGSAQMSYLVGLTKN